MTAFPERLKVLAGAAALLGTLATGAVAQETVRMAYHWGPKHPAAQGVEAFVARVNERLEGKLVIETFPSGQLFGIRDTLNGVTSGAVQMGGIAPIINFPPINRNYNINAIPGLFASYDDMRDFWTENPVGRREWDKMVKTSNIEVLAYDPLGPSVMISKDDICTLDALKGKSVRAQMEIDRPPWEAFEVGKVVRLSTGEVYTALQSGLIDTLRSVPAALPAYSWWDFIKYAQLPYGEFFEGLIVANKTWFDSQPDEVKQVMREVGQEISKETTATIMTDSDNIMKEFEEKHGGTVCHWPDGDEARLERLRDDVMFPRYQEMVDEDVLRAAMEMMVSRRE